MKFCTTSFLLFASSTYAQGSLLSLPTFLGSPTQTNRSQIYPASETNRFLRNITFDTAVNTTEFTQSESKAVIHNIAYCASTQRVRREIRDLTSEQRSQFLKAFIQLHMNGNFDDLIRMHGNKAQNDFGIIHFSEQFFPWHRLYLIELEDRLIALGTLWPDFGLPYWDWSIDSQNPKDSVIFTSDFLGSNEQSSWSDQFGKIKDSSMAGFMSSYPAKKYITREYKGEISAFTSSAVLEAMYLVENQSFSTFAQNFENVPHAKVHDNIGGDFGTWTSPNDPLFFLHHGFVDKSWNDWQRKGSNLQKFDGLAFNKLASKNDIIEDYAKPISFTLDITTLCYTYAQASNAAISRSTDVGITVLKQPSPLSDKWIKSMSLTSNSTASIDRLLAKSAAVTTKLNEQAAIGNSAYVSNLSLWFIGIFLIAFSL